MRLPKIDASATPRNAKKMAEDPGAGPADVQAQEPSIDMAYRQRIYNDFLSALLFDQAASLV